MWYVLVVDLQAIFFGAQSAGMFAQFDLAALLWVPHFKYVFVCLFTVGGAGMQELVSLVGVMLIGCCTARRPLQCTLLTNIYNYCVVYASRCVKVSRMDSDFPIFCSTSLLFLTA